MGKLVRGLKRLIKGVSLLAAETLLQLIELGGRDNLSRRSYTRVAALGVQSSSDFIHLWSNSSSDKNRVAVFDAVGNCYFFWWGVRRFVTDVMERLWLATNVVLIASC